MTTTPLTPAALRRLVTVAARGFDVRDTASLAAADAIVTMADSGMSSRTIAAALAETGARFAPAYGTVARYIKVRRSLPADVTAEAFVTALRAETAARSKAGAGNARAAGRRTAEPTVTTPSTSTVDGGAYEVVTADTALVMLHSLVTAAQRFDASDRATLAAAFLAAADVTMPTVRPVAA